MKSSLRLILVLMICFFCLLTTGCRDVKEIQYLNYATAIGVDYKDDKYYSYIQFVSLEGIARMEGQVSDKGTMWVSEVAADSFEDAFFEVYKTAQERIVWAHVSTILLSETVLKKGFDNIFDALTRYYEFRLTPWVFGTKEPINEILSTYGFYGRTSLDTILHAPMRIYGQSSEIRPIQLHRFSRELYEPAETTFIPTLMINKSHWKKDDEVDAKLAPDGAFFIQNEHYKGFYTLDQLNGLRWTTPDTRRAAVKIPDGGIPEYFIVIDYPRAKIEVLPNESSPRFTIHLKLKGYLTNRNLNQTLILQDIEQKTKNKIAEEIEGLFRLGVEKGVDFFNLEHQLFRKDFATWQHFRKNGEPILTEDSLQNINIELTIEHSGILKNRSVEIREIE
ncbi:Ger(x)C family spore germination protein [Anaerobacillus sp. MEB173]|uniref:Ger(x)C family spore germination protein n=1 Tax=Anaerobacillus sp. MEB173 TaxID=3383345 RepID=UPI003F8FCE71